MTIVERCLSSRTPDVIIIIPIVGQHRCEKRKSFSTGDPENSGFKRTQFKKYARPTRLDSKNEERNLKKTLLGGRAGRACFAWGNAANNRFRRSSNSEYLGYTSERGRRKPKVPRSLPHPNHHLTALQRLNFTVPYYICSNTSLSFNKDMIINCYAFCPEATARV